MRSVRISDGCVKLAEEFHVDEVVVEDLGERYNVAPTLDVYSIVTTSEGKRRMGSLRWGLVPGFAKDEKIGNRMINLRSETVTDKPAFRKLLDKRRCIVPADGFYEWQKKECPGRRLPRSSPSTSPRPTAGRSRSPRCGTAGRRPNSAAKTTSTRCEQSR